MVISKKYSSFVIPRINNESFLENHQYEITAIIGTSVVVTDRNNENVFVPLGDEDFTIVINKSKSKPIV